MLLQTHFWVMTQLTEKVAEALIVIDYLLDFKPMQLDFYAALTQTETNGQLACRKSQPTSYDIR